ncbi:hypothetical protein BE11_10330 [Sorangium cellulosum]|nr:hypothetical protein BE11_10330 [Sorangium cellulosum]
MNMRRSWLLIAAFLSIPAEASAEARGNKSVPTEDGIVAVFEDPKSAREECWAKVGSAADKKFRLRKLEGCSAELSDVERQEGAVVYSRPGDVTKVTLTKGSSETSYTLLWAIGSQGVLKNDDLRRLKEAGSKLYLVVADKDNTFVIHPTTAQLPYYTVDEDGILATSDDPAISSDECWTSDAAVIGGYRPKRLECVDLARIPKSELDQSTEVLYENSTSFLTVKLKGQGDPLTVRWALGNEGPIQQNTLKSLDPAKIDGEHLLVVEVVKDNKTEFRAVNAKRSISKPRIPDPNPWNMSSCKQDAHEEEEKHALVCIDLVDGFRTIHAPPANLLEPNQSLIVVVRHTAGEKVTLELSGDRRITPPMLSQESTGSEKRGELTQDQAYPRAIVQFSPRRPGVLDLKIKSELKGRDPAEYEVELEVDQRYWGAARFGLGTLFDLADNFHGYDVKTFAGSQTAQIRDAHIPVQFELVTGFALYPESLWDNGRSYADKGFSWKNIHVSPFLGFGLVGQDAKGIAALTSVHMGVELEFARDFSVALTAAWKRTRVLSAGYAPGSPVAASASEDEFSSTKFVPGFGVVLNATPSFLQFATGDATKEAK